MSSPMPRLTTGGPPANSCAMPRTITEKCDIETLIAPRPAHAPRATPTTGDCDNSGIQGQLG